GQPFGAPKSSLLFRRRDQVAEPAEQVAQAVRQVLARPRRQPVLRRHRSRQHPDPAYQQRVVFRPLLQRRHQAHPQHRDLLVQVLDLCCSLQVDPLRLAQTVVVEHLLRDAARALLADPLLACSDLTMGPSPLALSANSVRMFVDELQLVEQRVQRLLGQVLRRLQHPRARHNAAVSQSSRSIAIASSAFDPLSFTPHLLERSSLRLFSFLNYLPPSAFKISAEMKPVPARVIARTTTHAAGAASGTNPFVSREPTTTTLSARVPSEISARTNAAARRVDSSADSARWRKYAKFKATHSAVAASSPATAAR